MEFDFKSARHWAKALICAAVGEGGTVVDATMGNGYDTAWLCGLVGPDGRVFAFDIQPEAVARTRARLEALGLANRAELICAGHERMREFVPAPIDAALFNLGWLPGAEKSCTTRAETTLLAADACLSLLRPGGLLTLCVYPGHEEGARELAALDEWARALPPDEFDAMTQRFVNQPAHPPVLLAVKKQKGRAQ